MAEIIQHCSPILTGQGKSLFTTADDNNYYICQYRDDVHRDPKNPKGNSFITYCTKFEKEITEDFHCGMHCEEYGYCETCRGFSAVGCQVCEVPKGARKEQK
ncbi:MAG: hypothetical protein IKV96_03860 [Firmicutes bacterium]|nr:hypothetical protein [Bacillota bacterium]